MSNNLLPFPGAEPPGADEHARTETERKKQLFAWADRVLQQLDLAERVSQANSFEELRKITFDADAADVELAIRDALHPASGTKADHFAASKRASSRKFSRTASSR